MGWPGPMTHRQFRVWSRWLDDQWNSPSRTDQYLMQLALEIRAGNSKNPSSLTMQQFKLNFSSSTHRRKVRDADEASAYSHTAWTGRLGGRVRVMTQAQLEELVARQKLEQQRQKQGDPGIPHDPSTRRPHSERGGTRNRRREQ